MKRALVMPEADIDDNLDSPIVSTGVTPLTNVI
jgi:hypothetical protein